MRAKKRHSMLAVILMLGIGIPGSIGIFAVQAKAGEIQTGLSNALQAVFTSTPTGTATTPPSQFLTGTPGGSSDLSITPTSNPSSRVHAYIQAPSGPQDKPFVILKAFTSKPTTESISMISGLVNSKQFVCPGDTCILYLEGSSNLVFRAYTDTGAASDDVIASVNVDSGPDGYIVSVTSINQFTTFTNACSNTWGAYDEVNAKWDDFVQAPYELNTKKTLHTLATQLLLNGIVDASSCPAGGLSLSLDWPTACGLEKATPKMIEWQNQYDDYIWLASKDDGIPPKILKTLFEIESQFWPGNSRFYVDEYGLGQLNQLGVDVLLRRDPTLYQQVCPGVLANCTSPYVSLPPVEQAMIRGAVVSMTDASCPTCDYGLDLAKAKESVSLFSRLLKANCEQVDYVLALAVKPDADADAATATAVVATVIAGGDSPLTSYEDYWRFTFTAYHSGLSCLQDAVLATKKEKLPVTWENVSDNLKCKGGADYVDGFMETLFAFDSYNYQTTKVEDVAAVPVSTIVPTFTAVPSPTVVISTANVKVQVFMDRNGNKQPDDGEWIDAMSVLLTTSNNEEIRQRTVNGITIFDMTGYPPGLGITVSLPGLYRSESLTLPEQGEVLVTFMFEQPVLPTSLP
jgi:hypothetical protein